MATPGEYLPPLITELKADISNLKKGFTEAQALQKKYKEDVEGLGTTFKKTKTDVDKTGQAISDFDRLVGSKMRTSENAVSTLRTEYDRLHLRVKELRKELSRPDVGGSHSSAAKDLKDSLKDIAALGAIGADLGIKLADGVGKGIANGAAAGGPFVQAAIVTAIVTAAALAAPIVGATLATAIALGVGAGVIGLGAYILANDKDIKKAWEKLTTTTSKVFERAAQPMKKPFLQALGWLNTEFKKLEPQLKAMFAAAGPLVKPLTEGIFGLLKNMLPGITDALKNAQPLFITLGEKLPGIGTALGDFFRIISENKDDLSLFLSSSITVMILFIHVTARMIQALTWLYGRFSDASMAVGNWLTGIKTQIGEWKDKVVEWAKTKFKDLGKSIMSGLRQGIIDGGTGLADTVVNKIKGAWEAAKNFLKTGSPSKLFAQLGEWTALGYAKGIDDNKAKVWASWAGLVAPGNRGGATTALAMSAARGVNAGGQRLAIESTPVVLQLDGRVIYQGLIPHAQRGKLRNGSTGLG